MNNHSRHVNPEERDNLGRSVIHGVYKPHIDGLRGLAVIPVLLFHLNESLVPGGYVGVDVFFVISGFLITGAIFRDLQSGKFSLSGFYHRRVKRILPAYLTLVVVVMATAMLLYSHPALEAASKTAFSSAVFATNLRFWSNNDYFAPAAQEDPLLHMWSLGVEEQFYIVIPLLMWAGFRFGRKSVIVTLFTLFLASLALACWQVANESFRDAFYLPHSRAWELLAGSLVACAFAERFRGGAKILAPFGLVLIITAYILFSPLTAFPGPSAILPVVGAALLLHFGNVGWVGRLLASKPLVVVGQISYSLYLWHWPIIVFWKYLSFGRFDWHDQVGALGVSFVLAWVSWRWIEIPTRMSTTWTPAKSLALVATGCIAVASLTVAVFMTDGARNWLHPEANRLVVRNAVPTEFDGIQLHIASSSAHWSEITTQQLDDPETYPPALVAIGKRDVSPDFILWGDSHAAAIITGIDSVAREAGHGGFFLNRQHGLQRARTEFYQPVIDWLSTRNDLTTVILVQRWALRFGDPQMRKLMTETCRQLHAAGKRVLIFNQPAEFSFDVTQFRAKAKILGTEPRPPVVPIDQYMFVQRHSREVFDKITANGWAEVLPYDKVFLRGNHYIGTNDDVLLYMDSNHLSPLGVTMATEAIAPLVWAHTVR